MDLILFLEENGFPKKLFNNVLANKYKYTYNLKIKGKWQIAPTWEYKIIQKILKEYLTNNYTHHISLNATAYIQHKNISYNVEKHQGNNYFFVTDFKNFFPSINNDAIQNTLHDIEPKLLNFIIEISTFKNSLQYGFPTSPIVSNLVMNEFDKKLQHELEKSFPNKNIQYSRYSDDITISSKYIIKKDLIQDIISSLISNKPYNFLTINTKKTRYFEKYSKKPHITGLVPLNNRNTIGKRKINALKLNIFLLIKNIEITNNSFYKDTLSLKSYLSYLYLVDTHNYNRLKNYFFKRHQHNTIIETLFFK